MKNIFLILLLFSYLALHAQLDISSVSFDRLAEFPNEVHYKDSIEYNKLIDFIEKANDPDSAFILQGIGCLWEASHDTSEYSRQDYGNYSIAQNIHFGDFNDDKIEDCIIDFAIWGCTAYFCKAY